MSFEFQAMCLFEYVRFLFVVDIYQERKMNEIITHNFSLDVFEKAIFFVWKT